MKTLKTGFSGLFMTLLLTYSVVATAQNSTDTAITYPVDLEKKVDGIFKAFDDQKKPGAAVAVVHKGQIVFKKGYGSANLEYDIPVTPSTIFHVASVSKQFTAFAILLLAEKGKLSIDDDIRKYIPEVPDFGKKITLRHLVTHTSGMRDQWNLLAMAGWRMDDVITKEHVLSLVSRQKELNFEPGEEFMYCNTGFTLLAEVVTRVSGQSFAEFTEANIFKPLNMTNTLFYDDHEKIVKNRAYSYYTDNSTEDNAYKKSVLSFANAGATSLFTTVEDLGLWAMNFKSLKVGSSAIIDQMNTPASLNDGSTFGRAMGQFVNTHKGLNQIQHGGADAGYRSYIGRFPDQEIAVVVFSNYATSRPSALALQVADLYLEPYFNEPEKPIANKPEKNYKKLKTKQLERFADNYWNEAGSYSRRIYVKNDTLRYFRGEGNESALAPISNTEFKMLGVEVDLRVKFDEKDGKRTMIVVINDGEPIISQAYIKPNYTADDLKEYAGSYYSEELDTGYDLVVKEGKLVATHTRHTDMEFTVAKADVFLGNRWFFSNIQFIREGNQIMGMQVSSGRVKNLWFKKG